MTSGTSAPGCDAGRSAPLGATADPAGVNFSVFAKHAALVELLLFDERGAAAPSRVIPLDSSSHRTYHYWHAFVPDLGSVVEPRSIALLASGLPTTERPSCP